MAFIPLLTPVAGVSGYRGNRRCDAPLATVVPRDFAGMITQKLLNYQGTRDAGRMRRPPIENVAGDGGGLGSAPASGRRPPRVGTRLGLAPASGWRPPRVGARLGLAPASGWRPPRVGARLGLAPASGWRPPRVGARLAPGYQPRLSTRSTKAGTTSVAGPWIDSANIEVPCDGSRLSSTVWARVYMRTWLTKPAAG
jgi:hypothetical protein